MIWLFAGVVFLSATLLFVVQPMIARIVLPLLGGSPSVWLTSMVFFQASLLLGYLYAHLLARRVPQRFQPVVHAVFLALAFIFLPMTIPAGWTPPSQNPSLWLLALLAVMVGLPFTIISATAPLVQSWFARTGREASANPYVLYAASNLGSVLGLLGYPLVVERELGLREQTRSWTIGYFCLSVLILVSGAVMIRALRRVDQSPAAKAKPVVPAAPLTAQRRGMWVLLAFVPSSLTLAVTLHISTDVAAVPMLWVIPLLIYLLTFAVAFAPRLSINPVRLAVPMGLVSLLIAGTMAIGMTTPVLPLLALHLAGLGLLALVCHLRLAHDRPPAEQLTEFYLWISLGGVLGGIFNALVAPLVFDTILEYPLMIMLACLLRPGRGGELEPPRATQLIDLAVWPLVVLLSFFTLDFAITLGPIREQFARLFGGPEKVPTEFVQAFVLAIPILVCLFLLIRKPRPAPFALALGVLMITGEFIVRQGIGEIVHTQRTFFGVVSVTQTENNWYSLKHGTTLHGVQSHNPFLSIIPTTYYHPTGPLGAVMKILWEAEDPRISRVAVIGLGTGTVAAYAGRGRQFDFYEIDPAVIEIAQDKRFFTYVIDARERGAEINMILGDARLSMAKAADPKYGVIVVDAFSSDAIPVHLLTLEATRVYLDRLMPNGIIAFHISNRFFDLRPALSGIAAKLGLTAVQMVDQAISPQEQGQAKYASAWVMLLRDPKDLEKIAKVFPSQAIPPRPGFRDWTDDYSNLISVMN